MRAQLGSWWGEIVMASQQKFTRGKLIESGVFARERQLASGAGRGGGSGGVWNWKEIKRQAGRDEQSGNVDSTCCKLSPLDWTWTHGSKCTPPLKWKVWPIAKAPTNGLIHSFLKNKIDKWPNKSPKNQ
jgi:hypothetical protein